MLATAIESQVESAQIRHIADGVCVRTAPSWPACDAFGRDKAHSTRSIKDRTQGPGIYSSQYVARRNADCPYRPIALTINALSYATLNLVRGIGTAASLTLRKWSAENRTSQQKEQ